MKALSLVLAVFLVSTQLGLCQVPCADLKIKTSSTILDGQLSKSFPPLWLAPDYKSVLVLTDTDTLYFSSNSGFSFTKVVVEKIEKFRDIVLAADQRTALIASSTTNHLFQSKDGGFTWTSVMPPGKMEYFEVHPTDSNLVLAQKTGCPGFGCSNDLYVSHDFGKNWMLLRTYVWLYNWHGDENMIVVLERNDKTGTQYGEPYDMQVIKSTVFFRSAPTVISTEVLGFLTTKTHIFVAKQDPALGLTMLVSTDGGQTFHDTRFPGGKLENRYTILDTSEGSTFVSVEHSSPFEELWGNVYLGDRFDTDFALSLDYNPRTYGGRCDFKRMLGLDGIYLANQYTAVNGMVMKSSTKHTLITYDKGGKWQRLPKPINHKGPCATEDVCKLNLFGNTNSGEWYTKAEAPGLVLSTGVVAPYIVNDLSELNVYFSRDAGWTWEHITNGSYTYEIGNRGAILMMMLDVIYTNVMKFSVDEGMTWQECTIVNETFDVEDIVSDPKMSSGVFLVHGKLGSKGMIKYIDFADVHERDCVGSNVPDTPGSDYETWEPSDSQGSNCLLGRNTKIVRRKRDAKCDNPVTMTKDETIVVKNCSCTQQNYQCDYCFTRVAGDTKCTLDTVTCPNYDPLKPPDHCKGTYTQTKGYRRVPGDTCDPSTGVDLMPTVVPCPFPEVVEPAPQDNSNHMFKVASSTRTVIVVIILVAFVTLLVVFIWYLSGQNSALREILMGCVPESYLPDFKVPAAQYSALEEMDADAPPIELEDSGDQVAELDDNHPEFDLEEGENKV